MDDWIVLDRPLMEFETSVASFDMFFAIDAMSASSFAARALDWTFHRFCVSCVAFRFVLIVLIVVSS
jgi:hypothetical protein